MTVKELIEKLKDEDGDRDVVLVYYTGKGFGEQREYRIAMDVFKTELLLQGLGGSIPYAYIEGVAIS